MYGRKPLIAVFFAYYAAILLCGPGHHALSGRFEELAFGQASPCEPDHSHGPIAHEDSDCAICAFFSTSPLAPPPASPTFHLPEDRCERRIEAIPPTQPPLTQATPRASPGPAA